MGEQYKKALQSYAVGVAENDEPFECLIFRAGGLMSHSNNVILGFFSNFKLQWFFDLSTFDLSKISLFPK